MLMFYYNQDFHINKACLRIYKQQQQQQQQNTLFRKKNYTKIVQQFA